MVLPRWTAYVALAGIATLLASGIPRRVTPAIDAPHIVDPTYPRLVVLGIDGLDPDILREVLAAYPERMPNFARLIAEADGILDLGTSNPPQSPVAWSNFITGRNPGGHGIYDFIHRDPSSYNIHVGTQTAGHEGAIDLPGVWQFPTMDGGDPNRSGKAFWTMLGEAGVPADVWRMPINFPVEPSARGVSFPGMMTPAVDSAYGEPSLYSTDPPIDRIDDEKVIQITVRNGVVRTHLLGPNNSFKDVKPRTRIPLNIYVDEDAQAAVVEIAGVSMVLEPGDWSEFVPVSFSMLPMGLMDMNGIVRFYLRSISPEVELYASPVNYDPKSPIEPVSLPEKAATELAEGIGLYYTQGMAEDVNALKKLMLTDEEFMQQAQLVYEERGRMLDFALDKYMAKEDGGFLFFYYSTVDLCCHMMWRHSDPEHPFHDEVIASQDSSRWSTRAGSTWKDVVADLYMKMDPILGRIRARVGDDTPIMVMSDHGFAGYRRKFSLNTWLLDNGYLVLKEGVERELPRDHKGHKKVLIQTDVDWSQTRAYGVGFQGLYLNRTGREAQGIVNEGEAESLLAGIKSKLEAFRDGDKVVVLSANLATEIYTGERLDEAPDIVVGYNRGYGNSDEASLGRVTAAVLSDNLGGTFNGSHLMDPSVVCGTLLSNRPVLLDDPRLEDLTVEILGFYDVQPDESMRGRPVLDGLHHSSSD
jgi:predicted AlkP superfamily phosphohydrolase/phosphomutase